MQFLATMRIQPGVSKDQISSLNVMESVKTWELYRLDTLRTIWFIPGDPMPAGTIALLECDSQDEAEATCRELPFVRNNVAGLEITPLKPLTAYELLFNEDYRS